MSWKLDNIDFKAFGVYVSKSTGVLDLPEIVDTSIDWFDANGRDYWQAIGDVKYSDKDVVLHCFLKAGGYSDFKAKTAAFFTALTGPGKRILLTPYGNTLDVSLQNEVVVTSPNSYFETMQTGVFTLRLTVSGDDRRKFMSIYNAGALVSVAPYSDGSLKKSLGGIPEIAFSTEVNSSKNFGPGDYIIFNGEKYVSFDTPPEDQLASNKYRYKLTFKHQFYYLDDVQFRILGLSSTSWQSTVDEVITMLVTNSERLHPGLFVKGMVAFTQSKLNVFSGESCLSVLTRIVKDFELEWDFKTLENGSIQINVKQSIDTVTGLTFEYGKDKELYRVSRPVFSRENICTHLYAYGSEKNLPLTYGHPQLKLAVEPIVFPYDGDPVERTKTFDIKPERTGEVTSYAPGNPFGIVDPSMDFDLKEKDASGNTKWLIDGTTAKIVFNTGDMAGFEFEVQDYIHATKTFKLLPYTDETGEVYPTDVLFPTAGDEYKILDINVPDSYVTDAETRLSVVANVWLNELMTKDIPNELETKPRGAYQALYPGNLITLKHTSSGVEKTSRISEISTNLMNFVSVITLSTTVNTPLLAQISNNISGIESSVASVRSENAGSRLTGGLVSKTIPKLTKAVALIDTDKLEAHAVGKTESGYIDLAQLTAYMQSKFGVTIESTKTTWDRDMHIAGNLTASGDVIAYMASAVTGTVLDALSVSSPLVKTDTNIVLNLNPAHFSVTGGQLNYIGTVGMTSVNWTDIVSRPTLLSQFTNNLGNYGGFALQSSISNINNTSDIAKPVSTLQIAEFATKVDVISGKGLSTNDYTSVEKSKLSGIATSANNYSHPSTHAPSVIAQDASNRFVTDTEKGTWNGKQTALNGTGLVRMSGTGVSYDNTAYLPLTGGTMTGTINTLPPPLYTTITQCITAPINIPRTSTVEAGGFVPMMHSVTRIPTGYLKQVSIGQFRESGNGWNGGIYLGQGGNDNNPTEYFLMKFGGDLTHSNGNNFYHSGNLNKSTIPFTASTVTATNLDLNGGGNISGQVTTGLATSQKNAGIYGTYDSYRINHIWSMGSGFTVPADGTTFGNLYGMAYKHTNNTTGGTMAGGHQIVFCDNGQAKSAIGLGGGFWTSGTVTAAGLQINGAATATGTINSQNLVLNRSGNGVELLRFNTERPWTFTQYSTAGTAELRLNDTFGSKTFRIVDIPNGGNISFANGSIIASAEVTAFSDRRLKSNIQVLRLRGELSPVTYIKDGKASIGFIAQDVRQFYPELVLGDESKEMLSLNYQQLTAVLYAEILNLKREIRELKPN